MNQNFDEIDDFNNFEELLAHFERVVENRPNSEISVMTVTGLTKVLEDISAAHIRRLVNDFTMVNIIHCADNYCLT